MIQDEHPTTSMSSVKRKSLRSTTSPQKKQKLSTKARSEQPTITSYFSQKTTTNLILSIYNKAKYHHHHRHHHHRLHLQHQLLLSFKFWVSVYAHHGQNTWFQLFQISFILNFESLKGLQL